MLRSNVKAASAVVMVTRLKRPTQQRERERERERMDKVTWQRLLFHTHALLICFLFPCLITSLIQRRGRTTYYVHTLSDEESGDCGNDTISIRTRTNVRSMILFFVSLWKEADVRIDVDDGNKSNVTF